MATEKKLHRITEAYVWLGMRAEISKVIALCGLCAVNTRRREHVPMGQMPLATYAGQMISADLTGPLVVSDQGSKYILNIIDLFQGGWNDTVFQTNAMQQLLNNSSQTTFQGLVGPKFC